MRIDCPIPKCTGQVLTKRLDTFGLVMVCDGEAVHSDTLIRNAYARWNDDLEAMDPNSADEMLRRVDPIEYIRDQVLRAGENRIGGLRAPSKAMLVPPPSYPTGLGGVQNGRLLEYRGMTVLSGKASSGKTWSALRASLEAARRGWDVVYLAAEGPAVVHHRSVELCHGDRPPDAWTLRVIEFGTRPETFVAFLGESIRTERTLFVIDSFSTLMRMMDDGREDHWAQQRGLERLLYNIRHLTAGCVGLLVLSEANAAGETKGRSFDHIADLAVNFAKDEEDPETKRITVVKSWWGRMGDVGKFVVRPAQGGLVRLPDDGTSVSEQRGYAYAVGDDDGVF